MTEDLYYIALSSPYNLLLISGTPDQEALPRISSEPSPYVGNDSGGLLSLSGIVTDTDNELVLLAGNIKPTKCSLILAIRLHFPSNHLYIGTTQGDEYLVLEVQSTKLSIEVYHNTSATQRLYFYFTEDIKLLRSTSRIDHERHSKQQEIKELGMQYGCHVCGNTDTDFLPQLLPPAEFSHSAGRAWYPVCKTDYQRAEDEIKALLIADL